MKKEKKGLLRKMSFFFHDLLIMKQKKELEKNLRIAFINGICSISPKTMSLRRNKTHENALYKPCVFTKDKWCSMMPIFVLVSLLFLRFCTNKKQKVRNLRYKGGNYNIRTSFEFVFSPSILCVNLLYRDRSLSWNNEEISERRIETWKIVLSRIFT